MPLFNMFNNRLDDIINTFDKKDVISYCQTENATNPQLLDIKTNKITGNSQI